MRNIKSRKSGKTILIVCEGAKSEPFYFGDLVRTLGLKTVRIIGKKCGSSPLCVVNRAKEISTGKIDLIEKFNEGVDYDEVWCVFNQDQHTTLRDALDKAYGNNFKVALTKPCFEFWYLLHFRKTTKGFEDCDKVIDDLKSQISDYRKGSCPFEELFPNTDTAIENAEFVRKHGGGDPVTNVDELVSILISEQK